MDFNDDVNYEFDWDDKKARLNLAKHKVSFDEAKTIVQHFGPTITLDMDVAACFPDSESVNNALRTLIALVPNKQIGEKKAKYTVRKKSSKRTAARK